MSPSKIIVFLSRDYTFLHWKHTEKNFAVAKFHRKTKKERKSVLQWICKLSINLSSLKIVQQFGRPTPNKNWTDSFEVFLQSRRLGFPPTSLAPPPRGMGLSLTHPPLPSVIVVVVVNVVVLDYGWTSPHLLYTPTIVWLVHWDKNALPSWEDFWLKENKNGVQTERRSIERVWPLFRQKTGRRH